MNRILALLLLLTSFAVLAEDSDDPANVIRWATASESDTFGYDVYRGVSEQGPFERVTPQPIPGAGTSDVPNRYEFVDDAIEPETVYWYYVEAISMTGERERFTPIYAADPKPATPAAEG